MTKRALDLLVSVVTTIALCMACGTAGSGGDGGATGGSGGNGTGGTSGGGTGGSAGGGSGGANSTTPCGSTTCTADQVCTQQGCGGIPLPDSAPCQPPPPKCLPLPAGCKASLSCSCFDSLWATLPCGTITYGTLQCGQPCG